MMRLLVAGLHNEERRMIADSIRSAKECDLRAVMLAEMFELLELLLAGDMNIEQLRYVFTKTYADLDAK